MENVELFFGFPLDAAFLEQFQKVNPEISMMFIQNKSDYLQKISHNDRVFIGKNIGRVTDIDSLNLTQNHIISILNKLVPSYTFKSNALVLFPLSTT